MGNSVPKPGMCLRIPQSAKPHRGSEVFKLLLETCTFQPLISSQAHIQTSLSDTYLYFSPKHAQMSVSDTYLTFFPKQTSPGLSLAPLLRVSKLHGVLISPVDVRPRAAPLRSAATFPAPPLFADGPRLAPPASA